MLRDYTVRIYTHSTRESENIYVCSQSRDNAQLLVEELYPDSTVQMVFSEGEW